MIPFETLSQDPQFITMVNSLKEQLANYAHLVAARTLDATMTRGQLGAANAHIAELNARIAELEKNAVKAPDVSQQEKLTSTSQNKDSSDWGYANAINRAE